jgi:DNA-nicking Smr family endonuclease
MTKLRRARQLSAEERRLWAHVARAVTPFPGRLVPDVPEPPPEPSRNDAGPPPVARPERSPKPSTAPPLAPLERKTLTALRRGNRRADSVIDLHGMRQAEAHQALFAFLHRSRDLGDEVVLVITGKGAAATDGSLFEERGVLRRVVPHWLRLPELRPLVLGFDEAAPRHGGAGALYVRLRKRRPGKER